VEAVAEQNRIEVGVPESEAQARVEACLRAWKLPPPMIEEILTTMDCAETRSLGESESYPSGAACENAERIVRARLAEWLGNVFAPKEANISVEERVAMLWAGLPEKWQKNINDTVDLANAYSQGEMALKLSQQPQRPPETQPMTMETSLTRLPSFRIVAGWFAMIVLIILAFIFTR
jgi:hypothetical protein